MKYFVIFIFTFLILYGLYYITVIARKKRINHFKKSVQVHIIVNKYKLDIDQIDLLELMKTLAFSNSLIISVSFLATFLVQNIVFQLFLAFLVLVPSLLISYLWIGSKLKQKQNNKKHKEEK